MSVPSLIIGLCLGLLPACGGDPGFVPTLIRLDYAHNLGYSANGNIYVLWAENPAAGYYQPFDICERLLGPDPDDGTEITAQPQVLPFWHLGGFTRMSAVEVDAVSGPTRRRMDLSWTLVLAPDAPRKFTLYFETDVSFNANDWFIDQPSVLYKIEVDLDSGPGLWPMAFAGWTSHSSVLAQARAATGNSSLENGELQAEGRYITNLAAGATPSPGAFAGQDARSVTNMVAGLVLRIE